MVDRCDEPSDAYYGRCINILLLELNFPVVLRASSKPCCTSESLGDSRCYKVNLMSMSLFVVTAAIH